MVEETEEATEAAKISADDPKEHPALSRTSTYLPEEIIIWEILVRLPPKAVLRCRTVCRSWRRVTSSNDFVLAHHRREPSLPIICFSDADPIEIRDRYHLVVRDPGTAELRPFITCATGHGNFTVHAACDGLLIVSFNRHRAEEQRFYICNPATRHSAVLRQLLHQHAHIDADDPRIEISGLYLHHPSGDYRLLYWKKSRDGGSAVYFVLSLGSHSVEEPRCIGRPAASLSVEHKLTRGTPNSSQHSPVLLHGNLHWKQERYDDTDTITVFDTVAETFRWMNHPAMGPWLWLVEIDGTLVVYSTHDSIYIPNRVDLWVLEDYDAELWAFKRRIDLSTVDMELLGFVACPRFHRVAVLEEHGLLVEFPNCLVHCDSEGNYIANIPYDPHTHSSMWLTAHRLQESLVVLTLFRVEEIDGLGDDTPNFFLGL